MHAQRRGGREGGREWRAIGCLTLFRMKMSLAGARMVSGDKAWLSQSFIVLGGGGDCSCGTCTVGRSCCVLFWILWPDDGVQHS